MTLHKHNSTRTGSARTANADAYHITYKDGLYRVYDKNGKFRVSFATQAAADAYITGRTAQHTQAARLANADA